MNRASFNLFQVVGFFADVLDLIDGHVSSLHQPDGLLTAWTPSCVRTLRFGMEFVFSQHFTVSLYPRRPATPVVTRCGDAVAYPRILVDPIFLEPLLRI